MSDNTEKNIQNSSNDNATNRVPEQERKGFLNVALVTAGFCICMSGLFTGASMAVGLSLKNALLSALIGNLVLTCYGGLVGYAGAREGVASSMLARHSFGFHGSKIVSLVLAISMGGWYAWQAGFFGITMNTMFPNAGFITNPAFAALWGGILMLLSAYFGYKGLAVLSYIIVPLITIVSICGIVVAVNQVGGFSAMAALPTAEPMGLGAGIVLAIGSFAGGASAQADITRYAKDAKAAWGGTIFGYMIANVFVIMAGFITCKATGDGSLPAAMLSLGLGFPALIVLVGAQWTTNDNNLYTSTLGIVNVFPKMKKKHVTVVVGVVASICGAMGITDYFVSWLNILGLFIPPMAGILAADYYLVKGAHYDFGPGTKYASWNVLALVAWVVGALVGKLLTWGVSTINAMAVTAVVYLVLMKTVGKTKAGLVGEVIEE